MVLQRTRLIREKIALLSAPRQVAAYLYKNLTSKAVFIVSLVNPVFRKSLTDKYTRWKQYSAVVKLKRSSTLEYKNINTRILSNVDICF